MDAGSGRYAPARTAGLIGQLIRFGFTTGASALLSLALPIVLHESFDIAEKIAVAIGFSSAFIANVFLVPLFVFRSEQGLARNSLIYVATSAGFRLAEYLVFLALLEGLSMDYRASVIIVLIVSSVTKFFVYRLIYAHRPAGHQ